MRAACIAGLVLAVGIAVAAAQEMKAPRISHAEVDWDAVTAELRTSEAFKPAGRRWRRRRRPGGCGRSAALNRATGGAVSQYRREPGPGAAAVRYRRRTCAIARPAWTLGATPNDYLAGFESTPFFQAGPGGYDAVVTARAADMKDLGIGYSDRIFINISGGARHLRPGGAQQRMTSLAGQRARSRPNSPAPSACSWRTTLRYTFVRYGVPYVVAIECFDGPSRYRKIACKDADKVADPLSPSR